MKLEVGDIVYVKCRIKGNVNDWDGNRLLESFVTGGGRQPFWSDPKNIFLPKKKDCELVDLDDLEKEGIL